MQFTRDSLEVVHETIHPLLLLLVGLVDHADVDVAVLRHRTPQRFQVGVHQLGELVHSFIKNLEI
jgi:hypothetical protein